MASNENFRNLESSQIDFNQMLAVSSGESNLKDIFKWMCLRYFLTQTTGSAVDKTIIYMKFVPNRYNNLKTIKFWLFKGVNIDIMLFKEFVERINIILDNLLMNSKANWRKFLQQKVRKFTNFKNLY